MRIKDEDGWVKDWVWITGTLVAFLVVLAGLVAGVSIGANHASHVDCLRLHEQTGLATHTVGTVDATCFIGVPGLGWVRSDMYRGVEVP